MLRDDASGASAVPKEGSGGESGVGCREQDPRGRCSAGGGLLEVTHKGPPDTAPLCCSATHKLRDGSQDQHPGRPELRRGKGRGQLSLERRLSWGEMAKGPGQRSR